MNKIKNLLFQPLQINLPRGKSIHFGPREIKEIKDSEICKEMRVSEKKKHISIKKIKTSKPKKSEGVNNG